MNDEGLAERVLQVARQEGLKIATAESCTGGMIAAALTDIAGSSDVFDRGFVTYSNEAKRQMLGVDPETLDAHGAVSSQTASEMVAGALANSSADIAVAVTGVAGPGGGSAEKPVGLVWFGYAKRSGPVKTEKCRFQQEDRASIRTAATQFALELLESLASSG